MQFPTERQNHQQNFPFPSPNEVVYETPPTFIWVPVERATGYTVTVTDVHGETVCTVHSTVHYATPAQKLEPGDYYWKIESDNGAVRASQKFTIAADALFFDRPTADEIVSGIPCEYPRLLFCKSDVPKLRETRAQALAILERNVETAYEHGMPNAPRYHADTETDWKNAYRVYFGTYRDYCDRDLVACALQYALKGDWVAGNHAKKLLLTICDWNPAGPCAQTDGYGDEVGLSNSRCLPAAFDLLYDLLDEKQRRYVAKTVAAYAYECEERILAVNYTLNPSNSHVGRIPAYLGNAALVLHGTGIVPEAVLRRWLELALDIYGGIFPFYGGNDGSWAEGPFYASSYTKWFLPFFAAVERFSGKSLMNRPFYHRYTNFLIHFANMKYENHPFGDGYWCTPDSPEWPGFFAQNPYRVYADKFGPQLARERSAEAEDETSQYALHLLDLFLPTTQATHSLAHEPRDVEAFPDGGFVALHSDLHSPRDIAVLARASRFGADSHRHADQGSFALFAGGTALITPSGYFGAAYGTKHHFEWTCTSAAHNTLLIDGAGQPRNDSRSMGKIAVVDETRKYCKLDLSRAYPDTPLRRWEREIMVHGNRVILCDHVETEVETELSFLLHTLALPEVYGHAFVLSRNGVRLRVVAKEGLFTEPKISNRFGVSLNEGVSPEYAVYMPQQYHVTYQTGRAKTHRITVEFDVVYT